MPFTQAVNKNITSNYTEWYALTLLSLYYYRPGPVSKASLHASHRELSEYDHIPRLSRRNLSLAADQVALVGGFANCLMGLVLPPLCYLASASHTTTTRSVRLCPVATQHAILPTTVARAHSIIIPGWGGTDRLGRLRFPQLRPRQHLSWLACKDSTDP